MNALSLIACLGKEGKSPLEIARELQARGVTTDNGKTVSTAMVEGFLRFAGLSVGVGALPAMEKIADAAWGRGVAPGAIVTCDDVQTTPGKIRKNRWHAGRTLSDELKANITRLYQYEHLKSNEIAERLGISLKKVAPFCAILSGFTMPPGEITVFVEDGQQITRCPPGYARGAYPQRNVGMKGGT